MHRKDLLRLCLRLPRRRRHEDRVAHQRQAPAVNQIFGELIAGSTAVENFVVTSDQIQASSLGYVRIEDDPEYFDGVNLGEVCVKVCTYGLLI